MRLSIWSHTGETFEANVTLSEEANRIAFKRLRDAFFAAMEEAALLMDVEPTPVVSADSNSGDA